MQIRPDTDTHQLLKDKHFLLSESQRIARIGTWIWEPPNPLIVWSDEMYRIYGVNPDAFTPAIDSLMPLLHVDDREAMANWIIACQHGDKPGELEFRITTPAGDARILSGRGEWQEATVESNARIVGTVQDITDRKLAETALRDSEARYRNIVETAEEGIWTIDTQARTTFVNPKMSRMLGYSVAEMQGRPVTNFMDDEGRAITTTNIVRRQQGIAEQHEFKFIRKDGSSLSCLLTTNPILDSAGQYAGALAMVTDITQRRTIEDSLRRSEAQLKAFVEDAPVSLAMFDRDMIYLQVSRRWLEDFRLREQDIRGRSHYDVFPKLSAAWRHFHQRGMQGEVIRQEEDKFLQDNGEVQWLRWEVRPWYEAANVVGGVLIFSEDITERKLAELALLESEVNYHTLIEYASDGIAVCDKQSRFLEVNSAICDMCGYTREQMLTMSAADFIIPSEISRIEIEAARVKPNEKVRSEWIFRNKEGASLTAEVSATELKDGRLLAIVRDVTERKRIESALRESEERFRQIAENIREVFWLFEVDTQRVVYVSPAYKSIWGRTVDELYSDSSNWRDAIHPEDQPRIIRAITNIVAAGKYMEIYRILRPDGSMRWIRDQAYPVLSASGQLLRIVGTAEDITESRELEQQLQHSQKLEAVGTLAGGIAHDFNNILASIIGFTSLASQQAENNQELRDNLDQIMKGSRRAADLVAQILTFSRTSGPELTIVSLADAVREASKLLRAAIPTAIEIETHIPPHVPAMLGNATQLHQVVMNLGTNAWQAMRDRIGRLSISLDVVIVDDTQARLLTNIDAGQYLRLTVKDTGCGIGAETQKRIFEPFFTTKAAGGGTGLGLSVVHGIVRAHRGTIRLHSEIDSGTLIEVFFPTNAGSPGAAQNTPAKIVMRGKGEQILFVDDEPSLVQLGKRILERYGYIATGETQVLRALGHIERNPEQFQMVVTDQSMPGLTGVEFASRIHALKPNMPIVIASGYAAALTTQQLANAGVSTVLQKPYSEDELAMAIYRQLNLQH